MKFFKKAFLLSLVLIAVIVTLTSCSKKKVTLSAEKNEISVIIGENVNLKLSATEVKKFTEQDILENLDITSSDDKIVKIEADKITAVGIGTANVTATWKEYDGATVTVKVNVIAPEVGEVTYSALPANVYVGDKFSITHTAGSDVTVTYTTSNKDVLSVDGNNFSALAKGTVKITATATNGYKEAKKEWDVEILQGEYTITYVLNGGENAEANPSKYDVRELPLSIAAATKAHKTFLGWTKEAESTDYVTEIAAGATGDITLYAQFADIVHNIVYELDGGILPEEAPIAFVEGEGIQLVNPTKAHKVFLGWTKEAGSTDYVTEISTEEIGNVTLYANYADITHNISYELDGGKLPEEAPLTYIEGEGVQLVNPTKDGYTFLGWAKEAGSTNYVTEVGKDEIGEFKIYANWEKNPVYSNIVYELDGGTLPEEAPLTYEEGVGCVLPIPNKDGYNFLGWTKTKTSTKYIAEIATDVTGEFKVYAKWEKIPVFSKIVYELNGGTNSADAKKEYEEGVGYKLPTPTKEGFDFLGWTKVAESTEYITEIGTDATGEFKVYAQWKKEPVLSNVIYELNGGKNPENAEDKYEEGVGYKLPTPTKDGYTFLGWTKVAESTEYITEIGKDVTGEFKVYAQWEKQIIKSAIKYNLDGGVLSDGYATEYTEGEALVLPIPTKERFDFLGWSTVEGGTSYINEISATATGEFVVYANWKEKLVILEGYKYVGEGLDFVTLDEAIQGVSDGDKIMLPAGEYSLGVVIDKNIEIHGPNANLQPTSFKSSEAIINVAKDVAGNIAAKNVVFNGVHLKGIGGGSGTPGVYFQDGGNIETLKFKSCVVTDMNTFIKFKDSSSQAEIIVEDCKINTIGQFIIWVQAAQTKKVILTGSIVDGSTCGAVSNSAAALFRIRSGAFEAYNNYFIGNSINEPGYFESIAAESYVKYNTFEGVSKFAHSGAANKLVFDENLYLDAKGKVLTEVPSQVGVNGVTKDTDIALNEADRASRYMRYLATIESERYFLVTFDVAGGEFLGTYPLAYDKEVGIESLPFVSREGYLFSGWYLNDELVESIPAGTTGALTLVAKWREPYLIVDGTTEIGHYQTITAALAAAQEGDIIKLVAGTYNENVTISIANLTIQGPNVGVAGHAENRAAEAIITSVFTVNASARNLKIDGLKFTGAAQVTGKTGDYDGFIFQNNLIVDSTLPVLEYKASTNYIDAGFIQFAYSAVNSVSNFAFNNNKFENVACENIHLGRNVNLTIDNNEFYNFTRDAVRIDGGYVYGVLSFTNNKFENQSVGTGQNGVYFKSYSGKGNTSTTIIFKGNEFIKCGGLDKAQPNSGAIGAWSYQENGGNIIIEENIFDHCYNYIYFRNNGCTVDTWSCIIKNNIFLGLPNDFYYQSYNGSSDTQSTNPHITVFESNYYEDNLGNVITDLSAYSSMFKHCKTSGTALTTKPTINEAEPLRYYTIIYVLDGGRYDAPNLVMSGYDFILGTPVREGWTFLGWSEKPNSTNYIEVIDKSNFDDITLYANWQRINSFIVTYDLNGGVSTESYLKTATPAATLEVNNYNYNEGAFWSGSNYTNNVFLGQASCDPGATFSDRIYIGKDPVTGLWVVLDIINSGPSSWADGAEYVLTISNSHNNKGTLHSIVVNSIKVGQVVAFSCDPLDMNHATPGNVHFYNDAPTESIITISVTTNDTLVTPSKLGSRFEGWYDTEGKKYETVFDLTEDVKLTAKWFELTPVTDMKVDAMTEEMITGDTFQIVASVLPTDAYFQDVIFTSSDPDIISVSETGLMKAINAGTCTITIRDYMSYAVKTYTVTVYSIPSIDVDFEDEFDGVLSVGEQVQIHAHALGKNTENAEIYYKSSNTSIATVDADGFVKALKEGEVIITVSDNTGSKYEVKIQLIVANLATETKVDQVLKLIADYNFAIVDAGNVCLYNDGTQRYYDSMYGSVNYFLFAPYIVEEKYYANSDAITDNSNHKDRRAEDTIEFVTVHDTATLTGTVHSIASSMSTGGTSIHYTTGNGEIVGVVREKYRAYHAGDGTGYSFSWLATGIKVGDQAPEFDMIKNGSTWYLTIDGQTTSISLPVSNGTKTIANPSKAHFTTLGPSYKIIDGYYYVAPFRVDFSQVAAGSIGNQGGNNNSVGIEMCVNVSGDIYDTWQRTGQLVADICVRNGLTLDRVKEHNTWSGKNCPQCIRAGSYWNEFMKMVEVNYIIMKDYKDAEITFKSNNPDIVNEIGRVINPPKTTTTVSYDVTVTIDGVSKTITLYSVIPGTTCWSQWDGSYPSSLIWNNGKFGKIF